MDGWYSKPINTLTKGYYSNHHSYFVFHCYRLYARAIHGCINSGISLCCFHSYAKATVKQSKSRNRQTKSLPTNSSSKAMTTPHACHFMMLHNYIISISYWLNSICVTFIWKHVLHTLDTANRKIGREECDEVQKNDKRVFVPCRSYRTLWCICVGQMAWAYSGLAMSLHCKAYLPFALTSAPSSFPMKINFAFDFYQFCSSSALIFMGSWWFALDSHMVRIKSVFVWS